MSQKWLIFHHEEDDILWIFTFVPLQKEKAMNDKKEDKKTKKAKENAEAEANEENHSENGEAKTNEVGRTKQRVCNHS